MSEMRLIDANALNPEPVSFDGKMMFVVMLNDIRNAPTVDAVPVRHGHWIYNKRTDSFGCSNCSMSMVRNVYSYCPWCGAKMDEVSK